MHSTHDLPLKHSPCRPRSRTLDLAVKTALVSMLFATTVHAQDAGPTPPAANTDQPSGQSQDT